MTHRMAHVVRSGAWSPGGGGGGVRNRPSPVLSIKYRYQLRAARRCCLVLPVASAYCLLMPMPLGTGYLLLAFGALVPSTYFSCRCYLLLISYLTSSGRG
jgi:hypothetical protein